MNAPHYKSREPRHDPECECGHGKRWHPYVGRIASWPTRCHLCECKGFLPAPRKEEQ